MTENSVTQFIVSKVKNSKYVAEYLSAKNVQGQTIRVLSYHKKDTCPNT